MRNPCPSCYADEGTFGDEGYRVHKSDCQLAAQIREAEAFIAVEEEQEEITCSR